MKITIITITYNSGKTVEETIKSILSQEYDDLEYIIVDGGSSDDTLEIVEKYSANIAKVISEPDRGISDAFNKGIRAATGEIIGIINSDDVLYSGALATVKQAFTEHRECDVIYGDTVRFRTVLGDGYVKKPDTDLTKMKYAFLLNHPSVFVTNNAYNRYGLFSEDYKCAMDYELLERMHFNGAKFVYIDAVFSGFREGGESLKRFRRTLQEHKKIAMTYGTPESQIDKYIKKIYFYQLIIGATQKLHIEKVLRRLIKKQKGISK